jgi:hypothetical protein
MIRVSCVIHISKLISVVESSSSHFLLLEVCSYTVRGCPWGTALCGERRKVCITHLFDSEQLKVGLCDHLREERVERDLTLCVLLNEDVGFFVNLNLGINLCVSCLPLLVLLSLVLYIHTCWVCFVVDQYLLVSLSCVYLVLVWSSYSSVGCQSFLQFLLLLLTIIFALN